MRTFTSWYRAYEQNECLNTRSAMNRAWNYATRQHAVENEQLADDNEKLMAILIEIVGCDLPMDAEIIINRHLALREK